MTKTDTPINVEAAQDPMTKDYDVSLCRCYTPRKIYVNNLMELGTNKSVHIYVERRTCKDVCSDVSEFTCSECGFNCDLTSWISPMEGIGRIVHHHHGTPKYCPNCGAEVIS